MRITIVGGGKVGFTLAQQLQSEGHDITIVDKRESTIEQINNALDVIGYVGNGASLPVLRSVGIENCDLLIATTASDEINLMCCLAAHHLGARHAIARVRNPEYSEQLYELKNDLGLSMSLNPERATAQEIARVLRFPSATRVELFAKGKVEMVSCRVPANCKLAGLKLSELSQKLNIKVLICAVDRNDEVVIPDGDFLITEGDVLYFTGAPKEIEKAFRKAGLLANPVHSVMITGGGRISYYLAASLSKSNIDIKIIEQNQERAEELAELLPRAVILQGDATDHELLNEEGISKTDAFVALTGLDEGNILAALYARKRNVPKVIAKVNNENLFSLIKGGELETIVSAKSVTINAILLYVRALAARREDGNVLSLYKLASGRVEILEFEAKTDMKSLINIPLSDLVTKKDVLIACIVRKGKAIIPSGSDIIMSGDSVLIVTSNNNFHKLTDILKERA